MQYQTLDEIRQRCSDTLPGFDGVEHDALLRAWVWDALRKIDTDKLGEITDATIKVIGGRGELPDDYLGLVGIARSPFYGVYSVDKGGRWVRGRDGTVSIRYYALPLDQEGYPYILDAAEDVVMAYINWQWMQLSQSKMQFQTAFAFRIDTNLNRENERKYKDELGHIRGELNMLTLEDSLRLRQFVQSHMVYRNS